MKPKIHIRSGEVVKDLKAGLSNEEVKQKYNLSDRQLHSLFEKLKAAKLLTGPDFEERSSRLGEALLSHLRKTPRIHPAVSIPVYVLDDLTTEYTLKDLSEGGFQIDGLSTKLGERQSFVVQGEELADVSPFSFEAECKWVKADSNKKEFYAGFAIVKIEPADLDELRKLVAQSG